MDRYVIKANGNKELFNKEKIQSSLIKAGSSQLLANFHIQQVWVITSDYITETFYKIMIYFIAIDFNYDSQFIICVIIKIYYIS